MPNHSSDLRSQVAELSNLLSRLEEREGNHHAELEKRVKALEAILIGGAISLAGLIIVFVISSVLRLGS